MRLIRILFLMTALFPIAVFGQSSTNMPVENGKPCVRTVRVEGFNHTCAPHHLTITANFDQNTETLTLGLKVPKDNTKKDCDYIWIPGEAHYFTDLVTFFKSKGCKSAKIATKFKRQIRRNRLYGNHVYQFNASVVCENCLFNEVFKINDNSLDTTIEIFKEFIAADGKSEMQLTFKVKDEADTVTVTLKNIIPVKEKGKKKGEFIPFVEYMANDIVINIAIERDKCLLSKKVIKDLTTLLDYLGKQKSDLEKMRFDVSNFEESSKTFDKTKEIMTAKIDEFGLARYMDSGCPTVDSIIDSIFAIKFMLPTYRMPDAREICEYISADIKFVDSLNQVLSAVVMDLSKMRSGVKTAEGNDNFYQTKGIALENVKGLNVKMYLNSPCPEMCQKAEELQHLINTLRWMKYAPEDGQQAKAESVKTVDENEIKTVVEKMNTLYNKWSVASEENKPRLKVEFDKIVMEMQEKIRIVPDADRNGKLKVIINEFNVAVESLSALMR